MKKSRTAGSKAIYLCLLVILSGLVVGAFLVSEMNPLVLLASSIVFFIPGRICGIVWREFFSGRKLLTLGRPLDAEKHFERFLMDVRSNPWKKKMIALSWGIYTSDIEVMTLNNLGVICLETGRFAEATAYFEQAIALDPEAPLPYYNLALIAVANNDVDLAEKHLKRSLELGFHGSSRDDLIRKAGELLAHFEGGQVAAGSAASADS